MAIVKWSGIGQVAGSGKLQGTVLLVNNVIRVWHKTKTVRDALTNQTKGIFSGISAAFKSLTPAQLLAWQGATPNFIRKNALAEVRQLTANQAFQRINNILTSLGLVTVSNPPGVAATDAIVNASSSIDVSANQFDTVVTTFLGAAVLPANTYIKFFATRQVGASKQKFSKSDYRFVAFYPPTTAITPLDVFTEYTNYFGPLVAGQRIGYALEWVFADPAGTNTFKQNGRFYSDDVVVP